MALTFRKPYLRDDTEKRDEQRHLGICRNFWFSSPDDSLMITVEKGSYAEEYCAANGYTYRYSGM